MGREERRKAERQQRRARRSSDTAPAAAGRRPDGALARAVLEELDGHRVSSSPIRVPDVGDGRTPAPAYSTAGASPSVDATASATSITTAACLRATLVGCDALDDVDPQALGLSYEFEAPTDGDPRPMTVRFEGRRIGVADPAAGPDDRFSVLEIIDRVVPGTGRVTLTARVEKIASGDWEVTARLEEITPSAADAAPIPGAAAASGTTGFAPVIRVYAPGAWIGAWPALVAIGAAVALSVQTLLAAHAGLPQPVVLVLSLVACVVGLVAARIYYTMEHPTRHRGLLNSAGGVCLQGFVLGAVGTVIVGALLLRLPVGVLLDVTTPGLLFGMAIGRVGCFLGGCCVGRPTGSRWGLWSSDRRVGARRIPTQLFESALALLVGLIALLLIVTPTSAPAGVVFVTAIAAYTLGRQLLFPLRNLARNTRHGRTLTMVLCGMVLVAATTIAVLT